MILIERISRSGAALLEAINWPKADVRRVHRMVRAGLIERQKQRRNQRNDGSYNYWMFRLTLAGREVRGELPLKSGTHESSSNIETQTTSPDQAKLHPAGFDIPEGYVLVPIKPTQTMIDAAKWALFRWREANGDPQKEAPVDEKHAIRWRAMVEAAR